MDSSATRRYVALLDQARSSDLKSMLRLWGGTQTRKAEMLEFIRAGLADPARVRAAVAGLNPLERQAMALVKWMGGRIEVGALNVGLRTLGIELPPSHNWHDRSERHVAQALIRRGLLLSDYEADPSYIPEYGQNMLFADERLLAPIEHLQPAPLAIQPVATPISSMYRRPPAVVVDVLSLLQMLSEIGGLQLTKAGSVRTGELRKLSRALKWDEYKIVVDGLSIPNPVMGLLDVLYHGGVLQRRDGLLVADGAVEQFAGRSYVEQIGTLLRGFLHLRGWREEQDDTWYYASGDRHPAARLALTILLMALPADSTDFYAADDLSGALFERVGGRFSISTPPHPPYSLHKSPQEMREEHQLWMERVQSEWMKVERPWIGAALKTWLYYIGLVELGFEGDLPVRARLTEIGRAVLHPAQAASFALPDQPDGTAWLVQPDFDVFLYLDRTTPEQIAFIERHAERVQSQPHITRYRLTRDSIYRGLESGTPLDELIARLRRGASAELPQNVIASIRDWAARREQIVLRRSRALLEFPDSQARDRAIANGLAGAPLGERFVLLDDARAALPRHVRVDYARPLTPCLAVSEDGLISMDRPARDLLIEPQLDYWADRAPGGWQLAEARVAATIRVGSPISDLTGLLQARLTHAMPRLLTVALRSWSGKKSTVALATITALRCAEPAVFAAIAGSAMLAPYLRGTLAPDVLLVDTESLAALRERLAWVGFEVSATLDVRKK